MAFDGFFGLVTLEAVPVSKFTVTTSQLYAIKLYLKEAPTLGLSSHIKIQNVLYQLVYKT